jgi:hypothetical protein
MNAVKTQRNTAAAGSAPPEVSGKLIIIGVLFVAIAGGIFSWFFRYNATHRAAAFWGPETAVLIRDAPRITLKRGPLTGSSLENEVDVSRARGLVHLRNALLEDRSFDWNTIDQPLSNLTKTDLFRWSLTFDNPNTGKNTTVYISDDLHFATRLGTKERQTVSTEPIAAGLREMFDEFTATSTPSAESKR